jgi:hypothetical protein
MGDYSDQKRPEPGRPQVQEHTKEVVKEVVKEVDVDAIAKAVAQALSGQTIIGEGNIVGKKVEEKESFDNTKTMEHLAQSMVVQRGNSEANFKDLGEVKTTKKDNSSVDKTIDLLKDIE